MLQGGDPVGSLGMGLAGASMMLGSGVDELSRIHCCRWSGIRLSIC